MRERILLAALALGAGYSAACDSKHLDGTDLHGVFDQSAAPLAAVTATPSSKKKKKEEADLPALPPETEREPLPGPCIAAAGKPAPKSERNGTRPGCRRARIMEDRDSEGTPRYACVYGTDDAEKRKPLPLVIFLHSEHDDGMAVERKTKLRGRTGKLDMSGDPLRPGFLLLAPQARRFNRLLRWDIDHVATDNLDAVAIDRFVDTLLGEGLVDRRQVYVIGESRGGLMAALYSHLRTDRVAAYGTYGADASRLAWSCTAPPTPAAILYRSCDSVATCANVERWLARRDNERAPTFSLRLGADRSLEPSCVTSQYRCGEKKGQVLHNRWPATREGELLEYLSRFSFKL